MKNLFVRLPLLAVVFSCSIINDGDLLTPEDLEKIRLAEIEIVQETEQKKSSSRLLVHPDSTINMSTPNGTLTRYAEMEFQNFQGSKLKFKSNAAGKITIYKVYLSDGRPYTLGVVKNEEIVELYRFRYNNAKRLAGITFFLGEDNIVTKDSIFWNDDGTIERIDRSAPSEPAMNGTITVEYGTVAPMRIMNFNAFGLEYSSTGGNCPDKSDIRFCYGYFRHSQFGGGDSPNLNFRYEFVSEVISAFVLEESPGGSGDPDTFYFHPLLIMKDEFDRGGDLLEIYMIDWWAPAGNSGSGSSGPSPNEFVKFNYIYGL